MSSRLPFFVSSPRENPRDFVKDIFPAMLAQGEPLYGYKTSEYIKDMGTADRYEKVSRGSQKRQDRALFASEPAPGDLSGPRWHPRGRGGPAALRRRPGTPLFAPGRGKDQRLGLPLLRRHKPTRGGAKPLRYGGRSRGPSQARDAPGRGRGYVDDIYFCPHHPDRGYPGENPRYKIDCNCRKPKTGMIEAASREHTRSRFPTPG